QRIDFLSETARAVWSSFLKADMSTTKLVASGLGGAIATKHLLMHFSRPDEERLSQTLAASGQIGDPSRTIALVTQNMSGHKMDYWLHRALNVHVDLHRNGSASVAAKITLKNDGPASGEPRYMIGPYDNRFHAGW